MKIEGCKQKTKHLFVGSKKDERNEEAVQQIRCVDYEYLLGLLKTMKIDCANADTITIRPQPMSSRACF